MFISLILSGVGGLGQPETRKSSIHLRLMTDLAAAQEDVSHHNKILQGLDDLLRESIYITTCKEYSNHTNEELDLLIYLVDGWSGETFGGHAWGTAAVA